MAADPSPGSTLAGCGTEVAGCAGRVHMTFELEAAAAGHVLGFAVNLHAVQETACLLARTEGFDLEAGVPRTVLVEFSLSDSCATPVDFATMSAIVDGPTHIASRQEWGIHYRLEP